MGISQKKSKFRAAGCLFVLMALILLLWPTVSLFIPEHGKVNAIHDLQKVYKKAGPLISGAFTNSLLQDFPFQGQIDWRLIKFKEPIIILKGRIDTNLLHSYVTNHLSTTFIWRCKEYIADGWPNPDEYPNVRWTNMLFRQEWGTGAYSTTSLDGNLDLQSGFAVLRSY